MWLLAAMCCDKNGHPLQDFLPNSTAEQVAGAIFIAAVLGVILLLMKMDFRRQDEAAQAQKEADAEDART